MGRPDSEHSSPTVSLPWSALSGLRPEGGLVSRTVSPSEEQRRPTVLIADDHTLVAEGLASLIKAEFEVLATAGNGQELLQAAQSHTPDIALVDVSMPVMSGVEAAQKLLATTPTCKIIFVSMHAKAEFVREAFGAGASGYVLKGSAASELVEAMHEVLRGNVYISRQIAGEVLSLFLHPRSAAPLTDRQRQVLRLISQGRSGKEIAESLHISVKTAQFHRATIMEKLDVHSTAELTRYAFDHGITS